MNILIIGQCTLHWGRMEFGNIGNYYIIEPLIRGFYKEFGDDINIRTTLQMSERFCKDEKVEVLPMDLYFGFNEKDLPTALEELAIAEYYNKYNVLLKETPFITEVLNSDLVVDFSGDIWGDNADFLGDNRFLVGLIKDRVAQLLGKKTAMIAGSPGPFNNIQTLSFAKEVFENFDVVTNREPISIEILKEKGFNISNTHSLACPSFLFSPSENINIKNILPDYNSKRPKVGFILCGWNFEEGPFDKSPREDSEYDKFADVVKYLINNLGCNVYLMSHSNGFPIPPKEFKLQHGRDYPIAKQLQKVLNNKGITEHLYSLDTVYNAWDTKAIIGNFDMLISGRVHGAIAGLSQFVPTVIIDYGHEPKAHKLLGFAKVAGVEEYVASPNSVEEMTEKISHLWGNMKDVKQILKSRVEKITTDVDENFKLLTNLFKNDI